MASAISATASNSMTQFNNGEVKTFSLVWLDTNTKGVFLYLDVKKTLRSTIDCIETFEQSDQCETYIRQSTEKCHHIVIIGEELADDFIPHIHNFSQVFSIYIYENSDQNEEHKSWTEKYPKVKNVYSQMEDLTTQIIIDRKRWLKISEPLVFTMFNIYNNTERSSVDINGTFLHAQLLIDLLLRLKSTEMNRKEFIDMCRKEFEGKQSILHMIDEFERNYSDEHAVWWYTRDTFVYRQLNKALRLQNIDWLFHFRFFIRDTYELLKLAARGTRKLFVI